MQQYLPLGSVVSLKNNEDDQKILIINRVPILKINNEIGYFDYDGCLLPQGEVGTNFYFNDEDIEEVNFYGLTDENQIQISIENGKKNFQRKHFKLKELEGEENEQN